MKIEEVNALSEDSGNEEGDILLTSSEEMAALITTNDTLMQDWIMDLGASFHVMPHNGWLKTYDAKRKG